MLQRFLGRAWKARTEFVKYFSIGISAFCLDVGSLYVFARFTSLPHYAAVIIYQPFILLFVFFANKYWSFQAAGLTSRQLRRFLSLSFINYLIATAWMWSFTVFLPLRLFGPSWDYLLVRLLNIILSMGWNFLLYKFWVYRISDVEALLKTIATIE